ncbi:MAG: PIN domain-containing protein, partial [Thermoplasmata archaeon]
LQVPPMRVLLDTNLLIGREDPDALSPTLAQLLQLLNENGVASLVHTASLKELDGDRDSARREIIRSKVGSYPVLESPPVPTAEFNQLLGVTSTNDRADAELAFSVYRNAVSFLITEDQELVHRAARAGLQERVVST